MSESFETAIDANYNMRKTNTIVMDSSRHNFKNKLYKFKQNMIIKKMSLFSFLLVFLS